MDPCFGREKRHADESGKSHRITVQNNCDRWIFIDCGFVERASLRGCLRAGEKSDDLVSASRKRDYVAHAARGVMLLHKIWTQNVQQRRWQPTLYSSVPLHPELVLHCI